MKKARVVMALLTLAAVAMSVAPGGAAIKKKTIGVRTYEVSGSVLTTGNADPTCDLSRVPVSADGLPHPSEIQPDDVPAEAPAYPALPSRVPEPAGSQLPKQCQVASDGSIDQGGLEFPKIGGRSRSAWVKAFITDEYTGTPVYFTLCQDFDNDTSCGESTGDPTNPDQTVNETSARGCSPGSPYVKVNTRYPITMFIWAASTGCEYLDEGTDTYLATRGTVKLVRYWL